MHIETYKARAPNGMSAALLACRSPGRNRDGVRMFCCRLNRPRLVLVLMVIREVLAQCSDSLIKLLVQHAVDAVEAISQLLQRTVLFNAAHVADNERGATDIIYSAL